MAPRDPGAPAQAFLPDPRSEGRGGPVRPHRSEFTRDFEELVAWPAAKTDKSAIERLLRIAWRTVGAVVERVVADELDPTA